MNSSQKRNQWVYISLILMILVLVAFSIMPLVSSIFLSRQAPTPNLSNQESRLESEVLGYQMVLEREPDNQSAWRGLLETRLKQGNLAEALLPLKRLAQLNPEVGEYQILLAQSQEQLQDYEGAIATYRQLVQQQPDNLRALKGYVDLLVAQKRTPEAIKLVQDSTKKALSNPADKLDVVALQLLLGEIYGTQGDYSQALTIYEQAQKSAPDDFRPWLAAALTLKQQGKTADAQPLFAKATALAPVAYKDQIKELGL